MVRFAPGGPFSTEKSHSPEAQAALEKQYHLDRSLPVQYFIYVSRLAVGDLGQSMKYPDKSVKEIISSRLPASILLGSAALAIAILLGISFGLAAGLKQSSPFDGTVMLFAVFGLSIPAFVIAPCLQLIFSMKWKVLPLAGYEGTDDLSYLVLPALTLSLPFIARIARITRSGVIDVASQDYIKTARAKGLSQINIIFRQILPGAILPVIAYLGPATAAILTGSIVIEKIFQIPGLGREFVESALNRDYTLVMGTVLVYGTFLVICNLISDSIGQWIDPRRKIGSKS